MTGSLVIAGTGRAGTSFLVRWFEACGLDIGETSGWHDDARAGLEQPVRPGAPRVVKDPWFYTYCSTIDPALVDVLIVPIRDLEAAARSRVQRETAALNGAVHGNEFGQTAGGMIHRLNVDDQARTIAVGFHTLIDWAVTQQVPLRLVSFPRIVDDETYLWDQLGDLTSVDGWSDRALARQAHRDLADPNLVRIR